MISAPHSQAAGTWTALSNLAPARIGTMLLLTDGTVLAFDSGTNGKCYKLTPNSSGSYVNGTWTTLASMISTRLYFSSQVLTNGKVFVGGSEYGTGEAGGPEIYDPVANTWTATSAPPTGDHFNDSVSSTLLNGNVLIHPANGAVTYNIATDTWTPGPNTRVSNQGEVSWVKLGNGGILTLDGGVVQTTEHYSPTLGSWVADPNMPVNLWDPNSEIGSGLLLPNGKVLYTGGTGHTNIYTSGASDSVAGTWVQGPDFPNGQGQSDAPGAMESNGLALYITGPANTFNTPASFYEYDWNSNSFTQITAPGNANLNFSGKSPFVCLFLVLPDGGILLSAQNSQLFEYTPAGSPLAAGVPSVNSIVANSDGSYTLSGTMLNGLNEGAAYGDDAQMATNYPIIRLKDSSGNVRYCKSYNWSTTGVATGSLVETVQFTLPSGLASGAYSLQAVANGIPSSPVAFKTNGTYLFEVESLTVSSSTQTVEPQTDGAMSNGAGSKLDGAGVGDNVVYLTPSIAAGTYTVSVGVKQLNTRGQFQVSASRADQNTYNNIGGTLDMYNSGSVYTEMTVGTWTPSSTNAKLFKFSVTGKNASSSGYSLDFDYIRLIKQ